MIPQGYKQTEIGVIPQDWNVHTLEMLYNITSSKRVFQSQWRKSGIPFYRAREIAVMSEGKSAPEDLYIDADLYNQYTRQYGSIKKDDVLITGVGTLGKVYVVKESDKFYFKDGNIIWLQFKDGFSSQYLKHQYDMPVLINQVFGNAGGSTVATYTITNAKSTKVPVPPLDEQKRIAEALSDADSMISSLEKLITKKKAVKQGTMQELLTGRKRLPGFAGEWRIINLGEISKIKTGDKNNEQKSEDGKYPFFVRSQQVERINTYSYDGEAILVPGEGNIGQIFHYINGKFDWHQRVYKISDFPEFICGKFIYYQMKFSFGEHALKNTVKATVDSLRLPTFENFGILVPPTIEEQNDIASVLSNMDNGIAALEQKLTKARQIKQGMMQQLLTGKIRLV